MPEFIAVLDENEEGFLFGSPRIEKSNGELCALHYTTNNRAFSLTVFND